jgi:hypothetical protein
MPFSRYFYFKSDTPADHDWKLKAKERNGQPARELGGYNPYGELGWNDELLVGDQRSESSYLVESLVKDAQVRAVEGKDGKVVEAKEGGDGEGGAIERPLSPWTEADKNKDLRRLDRKLARTLYLVVKREESGGWGLPAGELIGRENLHQVRLLGSLKDCLLLTDDVGSRTSSCPDCWSEHEYLDRGTCPSRSPHRRTFCITAGSENILYESANHGWASRSQGQLVWIE